jgi:hypothetical protein
MPSNDPTESIIEGLRTGTLVVVYLADVDLPAGCVVIGPPAVQEAEQARRIDRLVAAGGVVEVYNKDNHLLQRIGPVRRPRRATAARLWREALDVQQDADLRAFRQRWGVAVRAEDVQEFQQFIREHQTALLRHRLPKGVSEDLRERARHPRAGLLYRALQAEVGQQQIRPLTLSRCRFCGCVFAPSGRVIDCCGHRSCRRRRAAEMVRRRYWADPRVREQTKRRVARWRRRRRRAQEPAR